MLEARHGKLVGDPQTLQRGARDGVSHSAHTWILYLHPPERLKSTSPCWKQTCLLSISVHSPQVSALPVALSSCRAQGLPQLYMYPWMQLQTHSWAELGCSLSFGLLKQKSLFKGGHVLVGKKTASDPLASRLQHLKLPASCPVGLPEVMREGCCCTQRAGRMMRGLPNSPCPCFTQSLREVSLVEGP